MKGRDELVKNPLHCALRLVEEAANCASRKLRQVLSKNVLTIWQTDTRSQRQILYEGMRSLQRIV
jgi:hypothetical protein